MIWAGRFVGATVPSEATFVRIAVCAVRSRPHCPASHVRPRHFSSDAGGSRGFRERLRDLRSNGTPEIVFGITLLGLLAADRFVQSQQKNGRDHVVQMLEREIRAGEKAESFLPEMANKPRLFRCAVRKVFESFDGTKCLKGVREGDVVDVLEEGVGPGNAYNLCRTCEDGSDKDISVGWFPMTCLEKLP
uniref:SH3 domain-containing protein n=1 Tax=Odontella aurita TaxID=265563 RepID=A0A7S4KBU0_9STRA|mmetsp:Transcript_8974/g.26811  ORF Transcript_8974/g.26811 Transcript_8974/m.26811 type:complete len:190 (+) Transcript_8974:207-776(+)